LFSALEHERVPLRVLLRTPEATHLRAFTPENVILDQQLLTVAGERTTLQLALPAVRTLHLAPDHSLHVGGPGRTLLLSLAAADGESPRWSSALDALFEI
ncbi:MAG TPA: hypothetical protein VEA63_02270, partial [Opitutus sp.]|nr:hypothetical protein [Opitutus sp.]